MHLKEFYGLRSDFAVIGITGRVGSGCSLVASRLADAHFIKRIDSSRLKKGSVQVEDLKYNICYNFLSNGGNWQPFQIINYKNVLLLHLLFESVVNKTNDSTIVEIEKILTQNGRTKVTGWTNRFDLIDDSVFLTNQLRPFLSSKFDYFDSFRSVVNEALSLNDNFKAKEIAYSVYFDSRFSTFCQEFYKLLNDYNLIKRSRFTHDLAYNLKSNGTSSTKNTESKSLNHIYTIADTVNRIIKAWRGEHGTARFVIDSLKNSLELMYFKEKFSAFYMVAANKEDSARKIAIGEAVKLYGNTKSSEEAQETATKLLELDDAEYRSNDFKKGRFCSPDIENCIQKCDFHIFIEGDLQSSDYGSLNHQIVKLIALIRKPGIVPPSIHEHCMQIAYNAKSSSGCISRQVGAVITDVNYSIKAIGWNEVPEFQVPCGLRDIRDLLEGRKPEIFSEFEKNGGNYDDKRSFIIKAKAVSDSANMDNLEGRSCTYCFRDFHNAFEGEKNQVHTRSLHAEENAMLQITKYGGQGIIGGKLFTTASPCELCSKKAFQLGIKEIYYIDPYPGIATMHTLKNGTAKGSNPDLIMFRGAVGRAFHKLYEPFISQKDEVAILADFKPAARLEDKLKTLTNDPKLKEKIASKFSGKTVEEQQGIFDKYLNHILEN